MLVSIYTNPDDKTVTIYLSHPLTPDLCHPVIVMHGLSEVAMFADALLQSIEYLMGLEVVIKKGTSVDKLSTKVVDFINSI